MAVNNFAPTLAAVLGYEGGYVNDPRDTGGATNFGVTQKVYDNFLSRNGLPPGSVRSITPDQVGAIYKNNYWDQMRADELPPGLDHLVTDFGINSGVGLSARFLNRALGLTGDTVTDETIAKANQANVPELVGQITAMRRAMIESSTKIDPAFKEGLYNRVNAANEFSANLAKTPPFTPSPTDGVLGGSQTTPIGGGSPTDPGSTTLGQGVQPIDYNTLVDWSSFANKSATPGYGAQYGDFNNWLDTTPSPTDFANGSQTTPAAPGNLGSGIETYYGYGGYVAPDAFGQNSQTTPTAPGSLGGGIIASPPPPNGNVDPTAFGQGSQAGTVPPGSLGGGIIASPPPANGNVDPTAFGQGSQAGQVPPGSLGGGIIPAGPPPSGNVDPTAFGQGSQAGQVPPGSLGGGIIPSAPPNGNVGDTAFGQGSQAGTVPPGVLGSDVIPGSYNGNVDPTAFGSGSQAGGAAPGLLGGGITPSAPVPNIDPTSFGQNSQASPTGNGSFASYLGDPNKESVARLYATMLGRSPDEGGLDFWSNAMAHGSNYNDIARSIGNSTEFQNLPSSNAQFVDSLYQNGLGRHAEQGGLQYWTDQLNHGASRADLASQIAGSQEAAGFQHSTNGYSFDPSQGSEFRFASPQTTMTQPDFMYSPDQRTLATMYASALGRAPDEQGINYWTQQHGSGMDWDQIAHAIGGSDEAKSRTGSYNNAQFVDNLYENVLGRQGDDGGLRYWSSQLDNGNLDRSSLAWQFAQMPETQAYQDQTGGYSHSTGSDASNPFSFSSTDPSRFNMLDNVDYGQGTSDYNLPEISASPAGGNAWSNSYAATNSITNGMNASANHQTEQLLGGATQVNNDLLNQRQAVGAQQQQQFAQNVASTNATQFGPAPVGQLPQLAAFNPTFQPSFQNIGPSFL